MNAYTQIIKFEAAHKINTHLSRCRGIHGHSYKAEFICCAESGQEVNGGSYLTLKSRLDYWVIKNVDFGLILGSQEDLIFGENISKLDISQKIYYLNKEPTVTAIAEELYNISQGLLLDTGLKCVQVKLWESDYACGTFPFFNPDQSDQVLINIL